jgi:hypothetical protein
LSAGRGLSRNPRPAPLPRARGPWNIARPLPVTVAERAAARRGHSPRVQRHTHALPNDALLHRAPSRPWWPQAVQTPCPTPPPVTPPPRAPRRCRQETTPRPTRQRGRGRRERSRQRPMPPRSADGEPHPRSARSLTHQSEPCTRRSRRRAHHCTSLGRSAASPRPGAARHPSRWGRGTRVHRCRRSPTRRPRVESPC